MSPGKRAALGGLLGALLVLILHPKTAPYYAMSLWRLGSSKYLERSGLVFANINNMPQPRDLMEAAYWIQAACEIDRIKPGLTRSELKKLQVLADSCAKAQPDNAFWPQAQALFCDRLGQHGEALQFWLTASLKTRWDDLQNARLQSLIAGLQHEDGSRLSWQYAYAYNERSTTFPLMVYGLGRTLLDGVGLESKQDLELRTAILRNGRLLRDGARSITAGEFGFMLIDMAVFPPDLRRIPSQKRLLIARGSFVNQLRKSDLAPLAEESQRAFDSNEAWSALVQYQDTKDEARDRTIASIVTDTLAGSLVAISAIGALIALLGASIERFPVLQSILRNPIAPVIGIVMAILVYAGTQLPLPAIWVVLSMSFFVFEPSSIRRTAPETLGPLFRFVLIFLGISLMIILAFFVTGLSAPGLELFAAVGIPKEYTGGSTVLLALASIILGMVLVTGPAWGMVVRYSAQKLAGRALREFGIGICAWSLVLAVIAGPIVFEIDYLNSTQFEKIAFNEPTYYLIQ